MVPLIRQRDQVYQDLMGALAEHGVVDIPYKELKNGEREYVRTWYRETMRPLLMPQIIDPSHPFPHLKNKTLYAAALLREGDKRRLGIVGVPDVVPPIVLLPGRPGAFVRTEDILAHHLRKIFKIYQIEEQAVVSVTRNADLSYDEAMDQEDLDLRTQMTKLLRQRERLAPVRLEMQGEAPALRTMLLQRLKLAPEQSYVCACPLVLKYAYQLDSLDSGLFYPPHAPAYPAYLDREVPMWEQIRQRDVLLFYPYHSMQPFLDVLRQSASDPAVVSIQMTIYRVAKKSAVIKHLCAAAENGKDVTVADGAAGPVRRGQQHRLGPGAGGSGLPGDLRPRRLQVPLQDLPHHPAGEKRPVLCDPDRHRQLQRKDRSPVHGPLPHHRGPGHRRRTAWPFSRTWLIGDLRGSYDKLLVAPVSLKQTILRLIDGRDRPGQRRPHHHEDELPHRLRCHGKAGRGLPCRGADRSDRPGHLLPACPASPARRSTSPSPASWGAFWSTPASTASARGACGRCTYPPRTS